MNPVATSDAAFRGGACPTPEYTIAYTGNYTTSADANLNEEGVIGRWATGNGVVAWPESGKINRMHGDSRDR